MCKISNYFNNGLGGCDICSSDCGQCNGSLNNQCLSCPDPIADFILDNGKCVCKNGYNNLGVCKPCSIECASCAGPNVNQCLSCTNPQILLNGNCKCVAKNYFNSAAGICTVCSPFCQSCKGTGQADCLTCPNNDFILSLSGECLCIDPAKSNLGTGICVCKDKTYNDVNGSCRNCNIYC